MHRKQIYEIERYLSNKNCINIWFTPDDQVPYSKRQNNITKVRLKDNNTC